MFAPFKKIGAKIQMKKFEKCGHVMLNSERCYYSLAFYRKSTLVHIWILQFRFSTGSRLRRQPSHGSSSS